MAEAMGIGEKLAEDDLLRRYSTQPCDGVNAVSESGFKMSHNVTNTAYCPQQQVDGVHGQGVTWQGRRV